MSGSCFAKLFSVFSILREKFFFRFSFFCYKMVFLNELKVPQLKSFAKNFKLTGYNKVRKNDLVELISKQFKGISKEKKHKKYLRKGERKKDKKEFRRIEAEKREKIKD